MLFSVTSLITQDLPSHHSSILVAAALIAIFLVIDAHGHQMKKSIRKLTKIAGKAVTMIAEKYTAVAAMVIWLGTVRKGLVDEDGVFSILHP